MRIYNTLSRTTEELTAPNKKLNMFVCGPTVYDHIHAGNARTFVVFDVVAKYLRHRGFDVDYVQNITDVDDKIIKRAQEHDVDPLAFARDYEERFKEDMKAISVDSPRYERATDYIPQIIQQVKTLIDKGNAYFIEGDGWYFDLKTFPEYGKLSGRTAQMADDGVSRIDENSNKRNVGDFCLWKLSKPGEPVWETELGAGRPGWHIEDTAITEKKFGSQYDIHGGGRDLMFPHHEAEITQMESISGKKPFVRYWIHAGFLENKSEKMSKSLGNFTKLNELLGKYSKEAIRFFFLSAHYHAPLDFSEQALDAAEAATQRIREFRNKSAAVITKTEGGELGAFATKTYELSIEALDNDFNTPIALSVLFEFLRAANIAFTNQTVGKKDISGIIKILNLFGHQALGIVPIDTNYGNLPDKIQNLIDQREEARQKKDFASSDQLREQINRAGFSIDDTPYGPLIKRTK
ncbi:MAG: cysteine--tRNA ligase [Patescibacteria group bacterium]